MNKYFFSVVFILASFFLVSFLQADSRQKQKPKLDLKPLEDRAENGDAESQAALGIYYIAGREVEKDVKKGFDWLEKASKQNDSRGLYYFALCFLDGIGTEEDLPRGLALLQKSIDLGYVPAKTFLAKSMMLERYGLKKDVNRVLELFTSAAREEDPEAQFLLGLMYSGAEKDVKKNRQREMKWLTLAAMHGFVPAQRVLGAAYWEAGDEFWAREWLEAAADAGDAEAEYMLGLHALKGLDGESNPESAVLHFQNAAENGFAEAQYVLALTNDELGNDLETAYWFQRAALQGHKESQKELKKRTFSPEICTRLGMACLCGQAELYSLTDARHWFEQGIDHPLALASLAEMELLGIGGPKDEEKARELLEMGVKNGNPRCAELLAWKVFVDPATESDPEQLTRLLKSESPLLLTLKALSLYFGIGVNRDQAGAEKLFHQAAKTDAFAQEWLAFTMAFPFPEGVTGQKEVFAHIQKVADESKNAHALCLLGLAAMNGWQCEKDEARAVKFFTRAAELGCAPAEFQLFFACQFGLGVEPDPQKATVWLQRAMEKNFVPAVVLWNGKNASLVSK